MATATKGAPIASPPSTNGNLYPFTVEQYQHMERVGVFGADSVELIEGRVVRKGPMNPPHNVSAERVGDELRCRVPAGWCLRTEKDITLTESQPRPDAVIALGTRDDYSDHQPDASAIGLLVEVSDSSLDYDQTDKLRAYARDRIRVYWIVNIPARHLEVYTRPVAGNNPRYRQQQILAATDTVSVTIGGVVVGPIAVADLLPPA